MNEWSELGSELAKGVSETEGSGAAQWCSYVGLEVSTLVKKSRSDTKMVVSTVTTKVSFGLVTEFGF